MVEVPEEVCDLNPQKTCRFTTKLVPKLTPKEECSVVPRETCHLRFSSPVAGKKPLVTKWCMDDDNDILNGLKQAGGARLKANVDPDNSKSILGLGLVPPTEGFSTKISVTGPSSASKTSAAAGSSRPISSNDAVSFQQNKQSGGLRGRERPEPSQRGPTRPTTRGQSRPSSGAQGKPSRNGTGRPTRIGGQGRPNKSGSDNRGDGRKGNGVKKSNREQIKPATGGTRRPGNDPKTVVNFEKQNRGPELQNRGGQVQPTANIGQELQREEGQQRPSDLLKTNAIGKGPRKPQIQGRPRIASGGDRRPNQQTKGTASPALPSNSGQFTTPGFANVVPVLGNARQPSFGAGIGEPGLELGGESNSLVNPVASQAPESYLPPSSLDYPSPADLSFGLPQESYGVDSSEATKDENPVEANPTTGPRPLPGQLADLSDIHDYYDQLPNGLQSYYDQAEDYYYDDQYDQDLELAPPVAPDTGYGSPGRRQTRRVDPVKKEWTSYQELLG